MSVFITQKPTTPVAANSNVMYVVTSSNAYLDQFRYCADITDVVDRGGFDYQPVRLKFYPNINGVGITDLGQFMLRFMGWSPLSQRWENTVHTPNSANPTVVDFQVVFGEEYASSPSSSRVYYPGDPNDANATQTVTAFKGEVDPNAGTYNFNTSSLVSTNTNGPGFNIMSDCPALMTSSAGQTDYLREGIKCGFNDWQTITTLKTGSYRVALHQEAADGSVGAEITGSNYLTSQSFSTIGVGPRNMTQDLTFSPATVQDSATAWTRVTQTVGEAGYPTNGYPVDIMLPGHSKFPCTTGYNNNHTENPNDYVRFYFENRYGFWDYYNIYNTLKQTDKIQRRTFTNPFPDYNGTDSTYDINRRGETQFSVLQDQAFSITTDYVSQETADWLTQCFDSPDVYLAVTNRDQTRPSEGNTSYLSSLFIDGPKPIVVTNTNYTWQRDNNYDKLFQYTINFEMSNKTFIY